MSFAVGEIGILCNCRNYPECNGQERMVIGGLEERMGVNRDGSIFSSIAYLTCTPDGEERVTEPQFLRKKPPYDGNTKTTWNDLIVWKPRETAEIGLSKKTLGYVDEIRKLLEERL